MGEYWEKNFVSRNDWDDSASVYEGPSATEALLLPTGGVVFHYVWAPDQLGNPQCKVQFLIMNSTSKSKNKKNPVVL